MPTDQHQLSHLAPGYWGSFYKLELDVIFLEFLVYLVAAYQLISSLEKRGAERRHVTF